MKIMIFFNSMAPAGGIERVIANHIQFMSTDYEVILVTKDDRPCFYRLPETILHEYLNVDFKMDMKSRWRRISKIAHTMLITNSKLRAKIKKYNPVLMYVASPLGLLEAWAAGMSLRKIMVTEHSSYSAYNIVYQKIIYFLYPRVGLLMVPTKLDSEQYSRRGINNVYIPNPLSFYPEKVARLSSKLALSVGRLTDDKRHDLLLDLWKMSDLSQQGWRLLIIGKGENEKSLHNKIRYLGIESSVQIMSPTADILNMYLESSIFLLTSKTEGFGLVLIEAMACGVPCVAFDCPSGPRDIIEDGLNGRLLAEGDFSGYVKALQQIALDLNYRQKLSIQGRSYVKKFHLGTIGPKFIALLREAFSDIA